MKVLTAAQLEAASLKLLVAIQENIRAKPQSARFGLSSLARDLRCMGESGELLKKLRWLASKGYLSKDVSAVYDMTELGWAYAPPKPVRSAVTPFFDGIADLILRRPKRAKA